MKYTYYGPGPRHYPQIRHPEQPGVLWGFPGEEVDFGEDNPPGDGFWYDTGSGLPYTEPDPEPAAEPDTPSVEGGSEQGSDPDGTGPGQDEEE